MKNIKIIVGVLLVMALAIPTMASAQISAAAGHRRACSVQRHFLGGRSHLSWWRGTSKNPGDESLKTTTYRYGSGPCAKITFGRWHQIIDLVQEHLGSGSFHATGIKGSWRHTKTVQVPNTCGDDNGPSFSTPYGWFALRISNLNGRLLGTGTLKLRLAC